MGKHIKLTEEDLRKFIKAKVQEALEHNVNLGYKPAIGNKKRKPGDEIEDQMTKRRNTKLDEQQGPHDPSQIYDDVYPVLEEHLVSWGAGPVYGWRGDKGVAFPVKGGKWITIVPMGFNGYYNDDSFLVTISQYGTEDPDEADKAFGYVDIYQLPEAISKLVGSAAPLNERSIYRKGPDGEPDYEGEDGDGGNKTVTIELDEQDYAIAFKQVAGREPREEDFDRLPIDVQVKVNTNTTKTKGDYDTPGTSECDITGWEIVDPSCGGLEEMEMEVVKAAVGVHLEACDSNEL